MTNKYDVVVIGAGPAGYVAAIRCAQLGLHTACIDDRKDANGDPSLGGCCLNVGCIPSKALLDSSEHYDYMKSHIGSHGIGISNISLDVPKMLARKNAIVQRFSKGIEALFRANHVDWLRGRGKLINNKTVVVTSGEDGHTTGQLATSHVILACGSQPVELDAAPLDGELIVDSTGALEFQEVPQRIGIVGGGAIGLELGSVWRRLGSRVVLLEAMPDFLAMTDAQIAKEALRQFSSQGLDIRLGARLISTERHENEIMLSFQEGESNQELTVDRLIVAAGRRPNTNGTLSKESGVIVNEGGFIHVDEDCQTTLPNVYAIGDAVRGPMLAHKGSEEGIAVAERIAGIHASINYELIPSVIYTMPEIAWVGKSEKTLGTEGIPYAVGSFPFAANGRAQAMEQGSGFVKMIAHAKTDQILGVHVIGPGASELVAEAVLAMEYSATAEDLARTIHAHPTLSEALQEAALDIDKRAVHKLSA